MNKLIKILKIIVLTEIAIVIPIITAIYAWGMLAFTPENANECVVTGQFYGSYEAVDSNGNTNTYYQFKSNDNEVWWVLTESEIGFIPSENTEYVLVYDNNGTTKANKPCDCAPELDCECEVYDDVFLGVERIL